LVEVLVASMIGVFIAVVAAGALRALTASSELADQNINAAAEVRFAANMIARDLQNLYRDQSIENTRLIGTLEELDQNSSTSYLIFYTLGRTKAREDQPEGDLYEVEYFLAKEGETSMLMRRLWPNPSKDVEPGGVLTVIAEDIEVFEVQYFDGEAWNYEWPEDMQSLPELVTVTIAGKPLGRGGPLTESFIVSLVRAQGGDITALESTGQTESGSATTGTTTE
jgi:type II secretion system protein J